jgi:hypothetical protein
MEATRRGNSKILWIKKWVVRLTAGVNPRTPCRQLFKELNILNIVSLYILEVISYLRRHHQFVELNSNVHAYTYNIRRKRNIHIQSYKTDLYKRSVINMGSKLYNKLPDYIKETVIKPSGNNWNRSFFGTPFIQ